MSASSAHCWRRPSGRGMAEGFPWAVAMAFGLGRLGLSSRDFWAMTPRELAAAVEGCLGTRAPPLDRAVLEALMARFPDRPER